VKEASIEGSSPPETTVKSIFDKPLEGISPELVEFLKLAEREGVYARLTPRRQYILEQYVVQGLSMPQIADSLRISKQAVSQSLKLSPMSMYRDMTRNVVEGKTQTSFTEIQTTYEALIKTLISRRKAR
jgi:predicted DNA-binding protein YlxM (UPF0122 family)